jgi:hypothetical protein
MRMSHPRILALWVCLIPGLAHAAPSPASIQRQLGRYVAEGERILSHRQSPSQLQTRNHRYTLGVMMRALDRELAAGHLDAIDGYRWTLDPSVRPRPLDPHLRMIVQKLRGNLARMAQRDWMSRLSFAKAGILFASLHSSFTSRREQIAKDGPGPDKDPARRALVDMQTELELLMANPKTSYRDLERYLAKGSGVYADLNRGIRRLKRLGIPTALPLTGRDMIRLWHPLLTPRWVTVEPTKVDGSKGHTPIELNWHDDLHSHEELGRAIRFSGRYGAALATAWWRKINRYLDTQPKGPELDAKALVLLHLHHEKGLRFTDLAKWGQGEPAHSDNGSGPFMREGEALVEEIMGRVKRPNDYQPLAPTLEETERLVRQAISELKALYASWDIVGGEIRERSSK